jgi:hypothetical protein
MIWRRLDRPALGLANSWSDQLARLESEQGTVLPDIRGARTLIITSDYGGYHKGARYETISFLLASLDGCADWEAKRTSLRMHLLPGGRRMSFKGMNDRHRRDALASFLDAANDIPGVLVSFCTSWDLRFALCRDEEVDRSWDELAPEVLFSPPSFRRLIRAAAFVSLFLAGLSAPMQDLLWFSDEDDFLADDRRIRAATNVFARVTSHYLPHSLRHFRFGSTRSDNGSRSIEDLAALPDLAAGTMTEMLTVAQAPDSLSSFREISQGLSLKSRYIASWIANASSALKKLTCVLSPGDRTDSVKTQWLQVETSPALVQPPSFGTHGFRGSIFGRIP